MKCKCRSLLLFGNTTGCCFHSAILFSVTLRLSVRRIFFIVTFVAIAVVSVATAVVVIAISLFLLLMLLLLCCCCCCYLYYNCCSCCSCCFSSFLSAVQCDVKIWHQGKVVQAWTTNSAGLEFGYHAPATVPKQ